MFTRFIYFFQFSSSVRLRHPNGTKAVHRGGRGEGREGERMKETRRENKDAADKILPEFTQPAHLE